MIKPTSPDTTDRKGGDAKDESIGVRTGDVIAGKYEIVARLGSGGMGVVFQARHQTIGKMVAIKIMRADLADDKQQTARFLQEARAANEVTHRNIVEVLDFGSHNDRPYMVMEYLRGEALSALMHREGRLVPAQVVALLSPVLRALAMAHQRGVIHRDIKPENIFLAKDEDGEQAIPKILDFGIAKRVVADDVRLTDTRAAFGTPAYMAPEQAMGARDVSPAADQYAMGVVLYEALSGRLPHEADTYNAVIVAKVTKPPSDLRAVCPDIDAGLAAVVMRALARDPADRYPTVAVLREALAPFSDLITVPPNHSFPRVSAPIDLALGATVPAATSDPAAVAPTAGAWSVSTNATTRAPRSRTIATVGITLAVGAIALLAIRFSHSSATITVTTAPSATPTPPVTFQLSFSPDNAEIWLDGSLVGHGHAQVVRPRDGARHELRVHAVGFDDLDEVITANADAQIDRNLEAIVPSASPIAPVVEPPQGSAPPEAAPSEAHPTPSARPRNSGNPESQPADSRHPRMDRDIHL